LAVNRAQLRRAFALTIRNLRRDKGLAQEQLALIAGLDRSFVGRIERGIHAPTIWTIYKFLPAFGISLRCFARTFEEALAVIVSRDSQRK
jgi:transcriptional regulator with XRE-family HTH domain